MSDAGRVSRQHALPPTRPGRRRGARRHRGHGTPSHRGAGRYPRSDRDERRPATIDPAQSVALKDEARTLKEQLANLTRGIKLGGALPALVAEMQSLERRKAEIQRSVTPSPVALVDVAKLEALMRQWREMFRSNVGLTRQILRELLAGERVIFTPRPEARRYDFVAPCTLDRVSASLGGMLRSG